VEFEFINEDYRTRCAESGQICHESKNLLLTIAEASRVIEAVAVPETQVEPFIECFDIVNRGRRR
jgi:hypothetical protein